MANVTYNEEKNEYIIELSNEMGDFSGGLNELSELAPNESPKLFNYYADKDGTLMPMPKFNQIANLPSNFLVKSAYSFYNSVGQVLVITDNKKILYSYNNQNWETIKKNGNDLELDDNFEVRFTSLNQKLYFTNGDDYPYCWDGTNLTQFTKYSDNQDALGLKARYICAYQNRIWLFNSNEDYEGLRFSNIGATEFDSTSVIFVRSPNSGFGTGIFPSLRGLIIFTNTSQFLLTGGSEEEYSLTQISNYGLLNSNSFIETHISGNFIFLSNDGWKLTDGIKTLPLTNKLKKTFENIIQVYTNKKFSLNYEGKNLSKMADYGTNSYYMPDNYYNHIYKYPGYYSQLYPTFFPGFNQYSQYGYFNPNFFKYSSPQNEFEQDTHWIFPSFGNEWRLSTGYGLGGHFLTLDNYYHGHGFRWTATKKIDVVFLGKGDIEIYRDTIFNSTWLPDYKIGSYENPKFYILYGLNKNIQSKRYNAITYNRFEKLKIGQRFRLKFEITLYNFGSINGYYNERGIYRFEGYSTNYFYTPYIYYESYDVKFNYAIKDYLINADYQTRDTPCAKIIFYYFYGRQAPISFSYYTLPIDIKLDKFGNCNIIYDTNFVYKPNYGLDLPYYEYYAYPFFFYNDVWRGNATDYGVLFKKVINNGVETTVVTNTLSQICSKLGIPENQVTKIKFNIVVTSNFTYKLLYPFRLESITFSYYKNTMDVPPPKTNISSILWEDKYLMAFCKPGDEINKYIVCIDNFDTNNPRYFLWKHINANCFVKFGEKIMLVDSDGQTNNYLRELIKDRNIGRYSLNCKPFYYETNYFKIPEGIYKHYKGINFYFEYHKDTPEISKFDPLNIIVEVWIDGKYSGTLKLYPYDLTNSLHVYHPVLNQYDSNNFYDTGENDITIYGSNNTPTTHIIGYGNKIKFKIYQYYPSNIGGIIQAIDYIRLKNIKIIATPIPVPQNYLWLTKIGVNI